MSNDLRWRYLSLYVFYQPLYETDDLRGRNRFVLRFYLPRCFTGDLRWRYLSLREERYRRKTRQRAPKPPFGFWLFIRGFGGETCVSPTNSHWCNLRDLGPSVACFALLPRTRLYCSNCGKNVGTERITNLICSRKLGGCVSLAVFLSSAARRGKGISDSAAADVIASHAPLRTRRHKARQNPPKHYPGDPMGAAAPLVCLSPLSFFKQRKMGDRKSVV